MHWVEVAIGSPRNRGLLIPIEEMHLYVLDEGDTKPVYRSMYLYDEEGKDYVNKNGTLKNYFGTRFIDEVLIDIDKGQNSDAFTLKNAQGILYELEQLGVQAGAIQPYFSGTGYHIALSGEVFNFPASKDLPFVVKNTMTSLIEGLDASVYQRTGIYRLPHTLNEKRGYFKVPLDITELMGLGVKEILKIAETQRLNYDYPDLWGDGELEEHVITEVPKIRALKTVVEPRNIVPCVQQMYKDGPSQGNRNNIILRIASHFRRNGIPSDATKASLLYWNDNQLEETVVHEKIEAVYNAGYKYSCHDNIMKEYCKPHCIHYNRKDYLIDVHTSDDLHKELRERLTSDFSGRVIDLARNLGINRDVIIFPGELVTVFGSTGANKTTLAHNLVLGYDSLYDIIRTEWQVPTLYLSLELSGWYMHRRSLQIISGKDKDYVNENYDSLYEAHHGQLQHIVFQTISPTIEQIKEKVKELNPACVVVDYIDLIEPPKGIRGEYETIRYISHQLSNLAVNYDCIIIQISQISRTYSRDQVLDLYAGKGSGAIENASRKVVGIEGEANSTAKSVSLFKNSDGDLFEGVKLEWTPSFRLRREDYAPSLDSSVVTRRQK